MGRGRGEGVGLGAAVAVGVAVAVAVGVGEGVPQGLTGQLKISVVAIMVSAITRRNRLLSRCYWCHRCRLRSCAPQLRMECPATMYC